MAIDFSNLEGNIDLQGAHKIVNLANPTQASDAVNKNYVDNQSRNLNNNRITGLADPINNQDAANKRFVESFVPPILNDAFRATLNHQIRYVTFTHTGGRNNLCTVEEEIL